MKINMKLFLANGRSSFICLLRLLVRELPGSQALMTTGVPSYTGLDQKSVSLFLTVAVTDGEERP